MDSKANNNAPEVEMETKEEAEANKEIKEEVKESKIVKEEEENNNNNDNPPSSVPSIEGASPGKIFVGGLPKDTTEEAFVKHFEKYGKIVDSVIMKHRGTRIPRGFGFITYENPAVVDAVIRDAHIFGGKQVEIKRTLPRGAISGKDFETKKIFVGGIPTTVNEDEFKNFFAKFGEIEEHLLMRDQTSGRSRGFGFISFSSEKAVDDLLIKGNRIEFAGAQVELKKAEPKKPGNALALPPPTKQHYSNSRPAFGRGRGRGAGRGRGLKDDYGGIKSGSYRYGAGSEGIRPSGYTGYGQSEHGGGYGGYGSMGVGSYRGDGGYGSTGMGSSYRGGPSLGFSGRYGGSVGRGYGTSGYNEPSESYGGYGGGAGGGYGSGGGGYDSGSSAGGYGSGAGYGSGGGAGMYGGRGNYGGPGGYEGGGPGGYEGGGPGGRYHPYSR